MGKKEPHMSIVTKKDLIASLAKDLSLPQKTVNQYFSAFLEEITHQLVQGNDVDLANFGKFVVKERCERQGINPTTKERITIPASKTVKFTAKRALKLAVNEPQSNDQKNDLDSTSQD